MLCSDVSVLLAETGGAPSLLGRPASNHISSCLRCQAEAAHYRRLLRDLRGMRSVLVNPDPDRLHDVVEHFRPLAEVHNLRRKSRRKAYIGGFAAAATAGAAGALVIASRLAARPKLAS